MFYAPAFHSRVHAPGSRAVDRSFERFVSDRLLSPAYSGLKFNQDDSAWTITLDLPGIAREQLSINVEGAVVRIETQDAAPRQFKAAYELAEEIDAEATTAKLENGVLELRLGKKKPVSNARTIEVR